MGKALPSTSISEPNSLASLSSLVFCLLLIFSLLFLSPFPSFLHRSLLHFPPPSILPRSLRFCYFHQFLFNHHPDCLTPPRSLSPKPQANPRWSRRMSNSPATQTPPSQTTSTTMQKQVQHPQPKFPFSAVKPPFVPPGDYHQFAAQLPRRVADHEADVITVKSPVSSLIDSSFSGRFWHVWELCLG